VKSHHQDFIIGLLRHTIIFDLPYGAPYSVIIIQYKDKLSTKTVFYVFIITWHESHFFV